MADRRQRLLGALESVGGDTVSDMVDTMMTDQKRLYSAALLIFVSQLYNRVGLKMMDSVTPSNPHGAITHAELKSLFDHSCPSFFRAIAPPFNTSHDYVYFGQFFEHVEKFSRKARDIIDQW